MRRCKKTEEREGQARRAPRCQASASPGRGGGRETEQPRPAEPAHTPPLPSEARPRGALPRLLAVTAEDTAPPSPGAHLQLREG